MTGVMIGGAWLFAWLWGLAPQWSAAGALTVKTNMALGQVLTGAALLLLGTGSVNSPRRFAGIAAATLVLLIGSITLSEHLFHYDLGIDQLLAIEPPGAMATASPNRMGPPGSISLALLGAGLLAFALRRWTIAPYLGLGVCLINLLPAVGFIYGVDQFYNLPRTGIAWPTVVALMSLGIGLVLAQPEGGPMALLLRDDPGGMLLRRVLPAALLIPMVLGFLRVQGERRGMYDTPTGTGIFAIALALLFSAFLWRSAAHLSRTGAEQAAAERAGRESAERYRSLFENMLEGFAYCKMLFDVHGQPIDFVYLDVNNAFGKLTGLEDVVGKNASEVIPGLKQSHPELFEIYGRVALTGQPERFEIELKPLGIWLSIAAYSTEKEYFVAVFDNVTARKQAEAAVQFSRQALEQERDLLQSVMNGAKNSHLVYLDRDFNFVRVNAAYAKTCGYTPEAMVGKNYFALYPDAENEAIFARVRDSGEPAQFYDKPFVFPDQPERGVTYWDWILTPVKDGQGVTGLVLSLFETTARKRAEEALRNERDFSTAVLDTAGALVVVLDRGGRITRFNRACEMVTGYSAEEVLGRGFWEFLIPAEEMPGVLQAWEALCAGDFPNNYENHWLAKDGSRRLIAWSNTAMVGAQGGIEYIIATGVDITSRKKAELALRESEKRYRSLFESMDEGFCVIEVLFDQDGRPNDWRFLEVNPAFERHNGLEQAKGKTIWELVPNIEPRWFDTYGRVAVSGEAVRIVEFSRAFDRWFDLYAFRVGEPEQRRVAVLFNNITSRKQAEQALRQSEERLAAIVGSAMDAIITVDQAQRIVMFNAAAENIFCCPASEAIGQPLDRFVPERFREQHRDHVAKFGGTGVTSRSMQSPGILYGLRANGQEFPLEATISHVTVAGQKLFTVILRDIAQRKQTEAALLTSEKLATVGRLAATVAHEINNPLAAVTNLLYLAQQNPTLDDSGRTYMKMAQAELTRAAQIAKQTLGFSKGGGAISRFRPTEVLDNVLLLCNPKLQNKEIQCERDFKSEVAVSGAESEIRQVFWNLLTNSIDAVPQGGCIKVRVSASLRDVGVPGVRVTIADNGHGVQADHLPHLFEPFFTTKHTGNGLGLWITSEIVGKHGGSIRVRSRAGMEERTGTIFSVFFPAEAPRTTEGQVVPAGEDQKKAAKKRAV